MMKDTPESQTNHCPMCEDSAKRIAELRAELFALAATVSDYLLFTAKSTDLSKAYHHACEVINSTPVQTAEQIERGHVEWMKTLPRMTGYFGGENVVAIPTLPDSKP